MKEFTEELSKELDDARKTIFNFNATSVQQLILQRFQLLTTISTIGFAIAGVTITIRGGLIRDIKLAVISLAIFVFISFISLGRHLYLLRDDIHGIIGKINKLKNNEWPLDPVKESDFKLDYWPEILYGCLIMGILLLSFSFI